MHIIFAFIVSRRRSSRSILLLGGFVLTRSVSSINRLNIGEDNRIQVCSNIAHQFVVNYKIMVTSISIV